MCADIIPNEHFTISLRGTDEIDCVNELQLHSRIF